MRIDEFMREVNKVAYAERDENDGIKIYVDEMAADDNDWFLCFSLSLKKSLCIYSWENLDRIDPSYLNRVLNLVQELRDTPTEERFSAKKYTVQIVPDDHAYLNRSKSNGKLFIDDDYEGGTVQTKFTPAEIDELKKRDDIAIDWGKAIINPVEDSDE